jgi:hypothetical protein
MSPEITTFRPAVEGFGEEAVVRLPAAHGVGVQHIGDAQQGVATGAQQGVAPQQNGCASGRLM